MHRRTVLGAIGAGATAACALPGATRTATARQSDGTCADPQLTTLQARENVQCDAGRGVEVELTVEAGDCEQFVRVQFRDGEEWRQFGTADLAAGEHRSMDRHSLSLQPGEAVRVRVLTRDGTVTDTGETVVDPFLGPTEPRIRAVDVASRTVGTGEPVAVTVEVGNGGRAGSVTAGLRSGSAQLDSADGTVAEAGLCLEPDPSTTVHLSATFEEPGTHPLSVTVQPPAEGGRGPTRAVGSVTVEEESGGRSGMPVRPGVVLAGVCGGLLALWRRGEEGTS